MSVAGDGPSPWSTEEGSADQEPPGKPLLPLRSDPQPGRARAAELRARVWPASAPPPRRVEGAPQQAGPPALGVQVGDSEGSPGGEAALTPGSAPSPAVV